MSRSESELDSASLHKAKVANLAERMKPATDGEETGESSRWAFRGDWRQRVGKERSRNLGDPTWRDAKVSEALEGRHNRQGGCGRESDRPIVARKRVMTVERRGRSQYALMSEEEWPRHRRRRSRSWLRWIAAPVPDRLVADRRCARGC
jgi:hypothetical protein